MLCVASLYFEKGFLFGGLRKQSKNFITTVSKLMSDTTDTVMQNWKGMRVNQPHCFFVYIPNNCPC